MIYLILGLAASILDDAPAEVLVVYVVGRVTCWVMILLESRTMICPKPVNLTLLRENMYMYKHLIALLIGCGLSTIVWSSDVSTVGKAAGQKAVMDLDSALKVVDAARTYAASHGWPCAISVVDDGGWTLAEVRMDNAPVVAGGDLAHGKARTAALFKRPTDDLEKSINGGRMAAVTAGLLMMKGGQPIKKHGVVVGGIGISADTPAHDDEIALAAISVLEK